MTWDLLVLFIYQISHLEFAGQPDDLLIGANQFQSLLFQFVQKRESLFLRQASLNRLNCLIVVHAHGPVLTLQIGQLDVVIHRGLVDPHDLERLTENRSGDKLGFGLGPRQLVQSFELYILKFVQPESVIITVQGGIFLRMPASLSAFLFMNLFARLLSDLSHKPID